MKVISLQRLIAKDARGKCILLALALLVFALAKFSFYHDADHIIHKDNYCAVCVSSANLSNAVPATFPVVEPISAQPLVYIATAEGLITRYALPPRSRAPPFITKQLT